MLHVIGFYGYECDLLERKIRLGAINAAGIFIHGEYGPLNKDTGSHSMVAYSMVARHET